MRGSRLFFSDLSPTLLPVGENEKPLINLRKAEHGEMDALQVRSIKFSKSLLLL